MITGANGLKTLCECKCKFDGGKCNSYQWWNNVKCRCECKKCHVCKTNYVWIPATCSCENGKYLASIMDDSAITWEEIIESYDEQTKTFLTNFNEKDITCRTQKSYIFLAFLLITTALLIAVSIYCYLIKCRAKQSSTTKITN